VQKLGLLSSVITGTAEAKANLNKGFEILLYLRVFYVSPRQLDPYNAEETQLKLFSFFYNAGGVLLWGPQQVKSSC